MLQGICILEIVLYVYKSDSLLITIYPTTSPKIVIPIAKNYTHPTKRNTERSTKQHNCHLSNVTRGFPGAFLGVTWGLGGVYLSEAPGNSQ